ncbi:hypothetical protein QAD02_015433 [Eretmocerus hayati]|uniref:Uncharacterized protein n=1 Tax=Eretmocerus hayati TaxID=131215 RepID=A0ACC2P9W6_9HYME|nr:hypothetical protein QAD02_015433 [Eretmocerus hayati]
MSAVLLVDRPQLNNDNFIVMISNQKAKQMKLLHNSIVQLIGNDSKRTVCTLHKSDCDSDKILMSRLIRHNLGVRLRDAVTVLPYSYIDLGITVRVALMEKQTATGLDVLKCKELLVDHFSGCRRTIYEGNKFIVRAKFASIVFHVIQTVPGPCCMVNEKTQIVLSQEVIRYKEGEIPLSEISYDDLGGISRALTQIREIEVPLRFPSLFRTCVDAKTPRILLYGPQGNGKVSMARALANETGAHFILYDGKTKWDNQLKAKFDEAKNYPSSVLCIDGMDAIAPITSKAKAVEKRRKDLLDMIVNLDYAPDSVVVVIGVVNDIRKLHSEIYSYFVFEPLLHKQIKVEISDTASRFQVLQVCTRDMNLPKYLNLWEVAAMTDDTFTAAQLSRLCSTVALLHKEKIEEFKSITIDDFKVSFE